MDYRTGRSMMMRLSMLVLLLSGLASAGQTLAKSAAEIDIGVQETLEQFRSEVKGGSKFLSKGRRPHPQSSTDRKRKHCRIAGLRISEFRD